MSDDPSVLRGKRIAEATIAVETAITNRTNAEQRVSEAKDRFTRATTDQEKQNATEEVNRATGVLTEAQEVEKQARQALKDLLGSGAVGSVVNWAVLGQYFIFGGLALLVLIGIGVGLYTGTLLQSVSNVATARGLITFLIAVATVAIAIILILATVVSESPDRSQRFLQGKEVFTALIGVLGAIVGFYFGQSVDGTRALEIAPVHISNENPRAGDKVNLVTFVSGGTAPYSYDVAFTPNVIPEIKQQHSTDGSIKLEVEVPKVQKDTDVSFQITVRDRDGKTAVYLSGNYGKKLNLKVAADGKPK
jgi:hypothetical protein